MLGVHNNEMRYLEIYDYENGEVIRIHDGYFGYMNGGAMNLAWYESIGFLDRLMKYENGEWIDVYNSYIDYDNENGGILKGYVLNGEYVSEEDFDNARENAASQPVTLEYFVSVDRLYLM